MNRKLLNLERALRSMDVKAFLLAASELPEDECDTIASRALATMPPDILAWWNSDACDLPHDGSDVIVLTMELLKRHGGQNSPA